MTMRKTLFLAGALAALCAERAGAQTTINFNSQACVGNPIVTSIVDGGYSFTSSHFHVSCSPPVISNGTASISQEGGNLGLPITMTKVGGGAFSFNGLDAARVFAPGTADGFPDADILNVLGTLMGGGTVSAQFSLAASGFSSYFLPGTFTNLSSVTFSGVVIGGSTNAGFVLDNLVVDGPTSTVPEPGTYALLATGLAAIGVAARRRRRA